MTMTEFARTYLSPDSMTAQLLTESQRRQIEYQLSLHDRDAPWEYVVTSCGDTFSLAVFPGVLQPMSSARLAQFIHEHPELYRDGTVVDIGTGCGIQGIVASRCGARTVVLSDISPDAVANARFNVERLGLPDCTVVQSDLFANVSTTEPDLVVFAHPYFGAPALEQYPVSKGMLDPGSLVPRFLAQAAERSSRLILMPFMELAGYTNDPARHGREMGYHVEEVLREELTNGIQRGSFSIYALTR